MPTNKELAKDVDELKGTLNEIYEVMKNITSLPKHHDVMNHQIGQDSVVEGEEDSAGLIVATEESVETPEGKEKLANLAFMSELVTIRIHESNEKKAQQLIPVGVNGREIVFKRGEPKTVKRCYVETLARSKQKSFSNEEYVDTDGVTKVRWPGSVGLRFPFEVIEDKNPMGREWLNSVLSQPV